MRSVKPESLKHIDKLLKQKRTWTFAELAQRLDVTYVTAKAWFELWAKQNSNAFMDGYDRRGERGPESYIVRGIR
jgi:hypothetical protein